MRRDNLFAGIVGDQCGGLGTEKLSRENNLSGASYPAREHGEINSRAWSAVG